MKPKGRSGIVVVVLVTALCAVSAMAWVFGRPETAFLYYEATGRLHEDCSWQASMQAAFYERDRRAARIDVARKSTLIGRDGVLALWRSPYGQAWIQQEQTQSWAAFWAGDLHHWPPRWAQFDLLPVAPVRPGSIVIDAGGHIGESANYALKMGAALVVSIEPDPLNAKALRRNLSDAVRSGRLIVVEKALWDREGTLTLERHEMSTETTADLHHGPGDGIEVAMTTLDQVVADLNLSRVDFIKMDIEGAEQPALRGASETLKRFHPILAIGAYHKPDDIDRIPEVVLTAVPSYTMTPLRCLMSRGRVIPSLLYFNVAGE